MAKFTQWVQQKKNRKWIYVFGGIALVIILFLLFRGRGSGASAGATTVVQTGPSEQLQAAQLSASTELQARSIDAQAAVQIEQLRAANEALSIERSIDALTIQEQGADRESQRAFEASLAGLQAERDVALAGIQSSQNVNIATLEAGVERDRIAAESVVNQQIAFMQGQVALERERSAVGIAQADAAVQIERARQTTVQQAISRAKRKHVASIVGGQESKGFGISTPFGGFSISDIRRKRNVKPTGARMDGIPSYTYEIVGAPGLNAGVIAQELELMHPEFVLHTPRGLLVDYMKMDAAA